MNCPGCGAPLSRKQRLCTTCKSHLAKYGEENPALMSAYVLLGLAEMERSLELHAAFDLYLTERSK